MTVVTRKMGITEATFVSRQKKVGELAEFRQPGRGECPVAADIALPPSLNLSAHFRQGLEIDAPDAFQTLLKAEAQFHAGGVEGRGAEFQGHEPGHGLLGQLLGQVLDLLGRVPQSLPQGQQHQVGLFLQSGDFALHRGQGTGVALHVAAFLHHLHPQAFQETQQEFPGGALPGTQVPDIRRDAHPGHLLAAGEKLAQSPGLDEEAFLELVEVMVSLGGGLPQKDAGVGLDIGEKQVPGHEALEHRGPGVKLLHGPVGLHLQLIGGELAGLEHGVVAVVLAPVPADDAVLRLHFLIGRGARQRRQDQVLQGVQVQLPGNLDGVPDHLIVVLFGAEDEHAVDLDAVAVEIDHALFDAFHRLGLVVGLQGGRVDGFQAHEDRKAAALGHEVQEFRVLGGLHPHLGAPFELQAFLDDAFAQFLGAGPVGGEVVVAEEDVVGLEAVLANLLHDAVHRVGAVFAAEQEDHRTEAAIKGTAPGGGDGDDALALLGLPAVDQAIIGDGQAVQVLHQRTPGILLNGVSPAKTEVLDATDVAAVFQGVHQLRQGPFAFAADDVVRVFQAFLGQKADMGAAHHHRQALFAIKIRQLIGPGGGGGDAGDADQVRFKIQRSVVRGEHLFDDHLDLQPLVLQDGSQ